MMKNTDHNQCNEHGRKHGRWIEYANGGVMKCSYMDGKKHGCWVERHADCREERGIYVNGARHGHWDLRGYGNVSAGAYVSGKQSGLWKWHGSYGEEAEGTMVNGKRHGRWIFRTTLGLVSEGYFVDGEMHGQLNFLFFDNGETKFECKNGVLVENRNDYCRCRQTPCLDDIHEDISRYFRPQHRR